MARSRTDVFPSVWNTWAMKTVRAKNADMGVSFVNVLVNAIVGKCPYREVKPTIGEK